jgi:hypothetical protein
MTMQRGEDREGMGEKEKWDKRRDISRSGERRHLTRGDRRSGREDTPTMSMCSSGAEREDTHEETRSGREDTPAMSMCSSGVEREDT